LKGGMEMKKLLLLVVLLSSALLLAGCDMFTDGVTNLWYDMEQKEIHLSYNIDKPFKDDDTGEYPIQFITLYIKYESSTDWEMITELDNYKEDDLVVPFSLSEFGNIDLKIVVTDVDGIQVDQSDIMSFYIEAPQYIWHFNANFDSWSGQVNFDYGIDENAISKISISKSKDGGLTWEEILEDNLSDENNKYNAFYYEFEEGNYVYKLEGFNALDEVVAQMKGYNEVNVTFEQKVFEGTPEIWHIDANFNVYDKSVNIWWDAQGMFDTFRVEKSLDGETWELVNEVPRIINTVRYTEESEGNYFYRVLAIDGEETLDSYQMEYTLRIDPDALLGYFDGWIDWNSNEIYLNWDFMQDERIEQVLVEKSVNGEDFVSIGEFGDMKKQFTDQEQAPGTYLYRISLLDNQQNVLDTLTSKEFVIEPPQHVHSLNAWHDQSTGEVHFDFGMNFEFVDNYVIEKSSDGGLTWETYYTGLITLNENNWYDNNISVYEPTEGIYAYRITGYDEEGNEMGSVTNYNEVVINYDHLNFEDPSQIYHLDVNFNIYDNTINAWWGSQGSYETNVLEYSTDGITFELLAEIPRVATFTTIGDIEDGVYYFKLKLVDSEGTVLDEFTTEYSVRVKEDALIGGFNVYYNWDSNEAQLYFDYMKDEVAMVRIERRLDSESEFTVLGEFGPLKTSYFDQITETNTYIYKLTLLDNNNEVLDEIVSEPHLLEVYNKD
jgi:hypothetical protein